MLLILYPLAALTLGLFIAGIWQVNKAKNNRITFILLSGLSAILIHDLAYVFEGNILGEDYNHFTTQFFLKAMVLLHSIGYLLLVIGFFLICRDYRKIREGSNQA